MRPARLNQALLLFTAMSLCVPLLVACSGSVGGAGSPPPVTPPAGDTTPPSVPLGVTVSATSPTQVQLTWIASLDAGTGVQGYRIFRDGSNVALATVGTVTQYTDSTVLANSTYSYALRAFDAASPANESALSAAVSVTTPAAPPVDTTPPSVPGNVTAVAQSSSQILLSWSASSDESGIGGYRVFRNGVDTPVATVQTTNYTDNGLTAATQYSYTVVAV